MIGTGRLVRVWVRVRARVRYRYDMGTVRVRYMGTVRTVHGYENRTHVPYTCTVPTIPMYRTRTVPVPYLYRILTRTQTRTKRPVLV
jgi:hypothetical protein